MDKLIDMLVTVEQWIVEVVGSDFNRTHKKMCDAIDEAIEVLRKSVEIDEGLLKAIEKNYEKNGYDLPETIDGWSDIINDLLQEKIVEDFGEGALDE
jgi:2-hydroxy-3-keto-5-methylthiopentenyl-1-phosphate phosphatase